MKRLVRILALLTLIVSCLLTLPATPAFAEQPKLNAVDAMLTTEFGKKIDLNNSDIRDFRDLRGFYPNLAGKIIKNSPYNKVEDVLSIPGLSERQKERLQANLDNFIVTPPSKEFNEGGDRINPGVY
ncbi:MAG: photosystem II complex extrinsic protein PsbU [Hydrococcus sp. C42_A2020_068]|uniref:photosystem II complex extrinsic protein PsbU n=1 Tax=Pleurocapsa sp. PCC 7327 TaxID=118163 RepID=UPI00029F9866|nr:photosystem II complex extrinsic protein PsbU [Pleurocapsa sp. PCC 7327]AFY75533.1 Photosystem II 12 kDa extrinsic protein (PsbU) [Pleurocapsa sp. PCC 7327]MBF2022027.1 photosystem II complex extrinsic protein PsbU [Hydrococcus sp. C42_A2020_068]